jgi:hypothetical protein
LYINSDDAITVTLLVNINSDDAITVRLLL